MINFFKKNELEKKFTAIFNNNGFNGTVSKSGLGSDLASTEQIRKELPRIFADFEIKRFIDAPCGDFYWMKETDLKGLEMYIGVDIVKNIIKTNQQHYSGDKITFIHKDLTRNKLPQADLVLCRDIFVHLSFEDIFRSLRNFKRSGIKYCLTTTFRNRESNSNLNYDIWRPLNFMIGPFNFPEPLLMIDEKCTEEYPKYSDKYLGLWDLEQIGEQSNKKVSR
jgi:hypothetical protein